MIHCGTHFLFVLLLLEVTVKAHSGGSRGLDINVGPCRVQFLESCYDTAIKFFFYSSLDNGTQLNSTDPIIPESYILQAPIKIIIHGWGGGLTTNFTYTIRDAYLTSGHPYNVVIVDWEPLSRILCYASSIVNTHQVATCTSHILNAFAQQEPHWDPAYLHLIGHSLGAHISAFISNDLLTKRGRRVGRITGLDPALPGFATLWLSAKLDPSDADFVDVMHTNAGTYGKIEPSGHADFYVNGGQVQPFCTTPGRHPGVCSHLLSMYYFAESIEHPNDFWGTPCNNEVAVFLLTKSVLLANSRWWTFSKPFRCPPPNTANLPQWIEAYMGDATDVRTRGTFYVETSANYPFGLGKPTNVTDLFFVAPNFVQEWYAEHIFTRRTTGQTAEGVKICIFFAGDDCLQI